MPLQLVQVEFVPAGKILLREGATPDQLVVVRQGAVKVSGGALPGVHDASNECSITCCLNALTPTPQ